MNRRRTLCTVLYRSAGTHCPHLTSLKVYDSASYRGLQSLQALLPCMTAQLQAVTLHGVHLARMECQASQLVHQLLQHCPNLKALDLQVSCSAAAELKNGLCLLCAQQKMAIKLLC